MPVNRDLGFINVYRVNDDAAARPVPDSARVSLLLKSFSFRLKIPGCLCSSTEPLADKKQH